MTIQDLVALAICAMALAWLAWRLLRAPGAKASRPDVTPAALLRRTREHRAGTTPGPGKPPSGAGGCTRC